LPLCGQVLPFAHVARALVIPRLLSHLRRYRLADKGQTELFFLTL
jgi:hypothetical protein